MRVEVSLKGEIVVPEAVDYNCHRRSAVAAACTVGKPSVAAAQG